MQRVYLSLNQGTTAIQKEFGRGALNELARRANLMAARLPERTTVCSDAAISIGAQSTLQKGYEAGHACGLEYDLAALPEEGRLVADLREIVRLYLTLTARGGVDTLPDVSNEDAAGGSITEQRRYRLHRRIERNGSVSSKVKRVRGYICEACGFDFAAIYGELGKGYIEAHHLTPLASLPVGQSVSQDPRTEFAVLCANCHRMVHSSRANPVSVEAIRALPGVRALRSSRGNK